MQPPTKTKRPIKTDLLTAEDLADIENADEARCRRMISDAGIAYRTVEQSMADDQDLQAAKAKAKELADPYREDIKREKQRIAKAHERLQIMGKAE